MNNKSIILDEDNFSNEEFIYYGEESGLAIYSAINWNNPIPYFMVFKGDIKSINPTLYYDNCDYNYSMCRLSMIEPKYIAAEAEDLILSKDDIDEIIMALNSTNNGITLFEYLIELYNYGHLEFDFRSYEEKQNFKEKYMITEHIKMPDYTKLL